MSNQGFLGFDTFKLKITFTNTLKQFQTPTDGIDAYTLSTLRDVTWRQNFQRTEILQRKSDPC